jgi:hypothetical protein
LTARMNAAARLDRLPTSAFHRRILALIAMGISFDGFDVYLAAPREAVKMLVPKHGITAFQYSYTAIGTLFLLDNA